MVLLLSTFNRDSVLALSEKTCTIYAALGQIRSAAARSKTWILESICPSQGTDLEHTGRTRAEPDHLILFPAALLEFRFIFIIILLFKSLEETGNLPT